MVWSGEITKFAILVMQNGKQGKAKIREIISVKYYDAQSHDERERFTRDIEK